MDQVGMQYIRTCVDEYKKFVGIEDFPTFSTLTKRLTPEYSQKTGHDALAITYYDFQTGKHTLEISDIFLLPQMSYDYLIFHELTHIVDAETYSQKNSVKHNSNRGYTEYHAGQIDFMKVLGAKSISEPFSFSMNQKVREFSGTKTAQEYMDSTRILAEELLSRPDFPANPATLVTTLGAIFIYYGRRSICKMYAVDFVDNSDMTVIAAFLGKGTIDSFDSFLTGWLNPAQISELDKQYFTFLVAFMLKYKL